MPIPPSGSVPVGNPQTGYLVKSSDLATVKIEGLDKLNPDDDMKTMVAKLQKLKPTVVGNAYRLNRILGEINARIGVGGGGGAGGTTVIQVGGGGSGGVVVATGLWSTSNNFLYPTAVTTTTVLNGLTSSDATNGFGSIACTNVMGVVSGPLNASAILLFINGTTETLIHSTFSGTGTVLPFSIYTNGNRRMTVAANGPVLVGLFSTDFFVNPGALVCSDACGAISGPTNANLIYFKVDATKCRITNTVSGTATLFPFAIQFNSTEIARFRVAGSFLLGLTSSDVGDNLGWMVMQGVFGIVNATTNANALFLSINGTTETIIHSSFSGTGTALPLSLYLSGVRYFTLLTSGALIGGAFTTDIAPTAGMIVLTSAYFLITATTNASTFEIHAGSGVFEFISSSSGTGSIVPVRFSFGGTEVARFTITGQFLMGFNSISADYSATSGRIIAATDVIVATATVNSSFIRMIITAGTETVLQSAGTGSGTVLPLSFYVSGTRSFTITSSGGVLIGGSISTDLSVGVGTFVQNSGSGSGFLVVSAATNASVFQMTVFGGLCSLLSNKTGTGTVLPITIAIGGTEFMRITTVGQVLVGLTSSDASNNAGNIYISNFFGILSATTNAHALFMSINGTTETVIHSSFSGTGTALPLSFYVNGNRLGTFNTNGAFTCGAISSDAFNSIGEIASVGANSAVGAASAATNASFIYLFCGGNPTVVTISSGHSGTGTTKPIAINSFGVEQARWTTAGAYYVGVTSSDFTNTTGVIVVGGAATSAFAVVSATTNATYIQMSITAGTEVFFDTNHTGTGTNLPLTVYVGGAARSRWTTTGQFMVGFSDAGGDYTATAGRIMASADVIVATATTNSSFVRIIVTGSTGELESGRTGTGTFLRMRFVTNGLEQATIDTTGRFILGFASSDSGGAGSLMSSFTCGVISAAANAHAILMSVNGTTETVLHSTFSGTGTSLPLSLYVNGIRGMTLTVANPVHVLIGTTTDDGTGALLQVHGTISSNGTVLTVP